MSRIYAVSRINAVLRPGLVLLLAVALAGCAGAPRTPQAPLEAQAPAAAAAPGASTGSLEGAPFLIEVPPSWNGELVMFLHGYEPVGTPRETPLAANDFDRWLLSEGFAVARSSYSAQGWAVAEALADNERLRQHAVKLLGKPRRTWLVGNSMGGLLVLASLERHPDAYDGGLSLCGVNSSAEEIIGRGGLDPLAAFDHYFPGTLGLAAGGLADPASPLSADPETIETALASNESRAGQLAASFDIHRGDLAGALMLQYLVLRELSVRAGGLPVSNRETVYRGFDDDVGLNAAVRRYDADPDAAAYLRANVTLTGKALRPVVILSNANDPTVPARFAGRYAELAQAAGYADQVLTLAPVGDGHCAFSQVDIGRALRELVQRPR
ncbi:MAG: hypothetical protein IPK27_00065 [Rhodanobacteraceae bacterium]|nr:hypothetical protein [Rhodanobacteraceae bacterium]